MNELHKDLSEKDERIDELIDDYEIQIQVNPDYISSAHEFLMLV